MTHIKLGAPPRPANGEGDVVLLVDDAEITFGWESGRLMRVSLAEDWAGDPKFVTERVETAGAASCRCCYFPGGEGTTKISWPQRCGDPCPPWYI